MAQALTKTIEARNGWELQAVGKRGGQLVTLDTPADEILLHIIKPSGACYEIYDGLSLNEAFAEFDRLSLGSKARKV